MADELALLQEEFTVTANGNFEGKNVLHQAGEVKGDLRSSRGVDIPVASGWLEQAMRVQEEFDQFLWSVELGGYYNTAKDAYQETIVRERTYADNATLSANGVTIANLVCFALLTEDITYLDWAFQALQAFSSVMKDYPQACPSLFIALDLYFHCTLVRTSWEQLDFLITQYLPASIFTLETELPAASVGLVCQGLSCLSPAQSLEELQQQIQQSQIRTM